VKEQRIAAAKQKARDVATHNVLAAAAASALEAQASADSEAGIAGKVTGAGVGTHLFSHSGNLVCVGLFFFFLRYK
jgi:hypothetical protein